MQNSQQADTVIGDHQFTSTLSTSQGFNTTPNEISVEDNSLGIAVLVMMSVCFLIWFALLNIGLQKIGVSVPKVIIKFAKDVAGLFRPRKGKANI